MDNMTNPENTKKRIRKRRDPAYDDLPRRKSDLLKRILIFAMVLVLPTVLWGFTGLIGLNGKLSFDTHENRNLHEFDENLSLGNLTSEVEAHYNDRVPFRSILLSTDRMLNSVVEFPYKNLIEPVLLAIANSGNQTADTEAFSPNRNLILKVQNRLLSLKGGEGLASEDHEHVFRLAEHADPDYEHYGYNIYRCLCGEEKKEYIEKPIDDSYFPYVEAEVIEGRYGWLYYIEEISDYIGGGIPDEATLAETASVLQNLQASAEAQGKTFFSISLPNKSRIYSEYMPTLERSDEWAVKTYADYMADVNPAPFYYPYDEMIAAKPVADLYYQLDTHWNQNGAIIGLNKIHEVLGMPSVKLSSLPTESYPHAGDLTYMQADPRNETCLRPLYKPEVNVEEEHDNSDGGYGLFSVGAAEFYSDADNDQTIVIIGDSYTVALMEYIPRDFSHAIFINRGYLESIGPSVLPDADIIIYECVERKFYYFLQDLYTLSALMN